MNPELQRVFDTYNDKMCLHPFFSVFYQTAVDKSGQANLIQPCCLSKLPNSLTTEHTIMQAINTNEWRAMRQAFVQGQFDNIEACKICIASEKHSSSSARIGGSQHCIDSLPADPVKLIQEIIDNDYRVDRVYSLQYNPSNYCNLECVMCNGATSSSRRVFEIRELGSQMPAVVTNDTEPDFWTVLHSVTNVSLAGGEPLLQPQVRRLIEYLVDNSLAKNVSITILTNATSYPEDLMEKFAQFKQVIYTVSVDGVGAVTEYQRRGTVWARTEPIALQLLKNPHLSAVVNYVMTSINALSFVDFIDWIADNNIEYVGLSHEHSGDRLSVASLPPALRAVAIQRIDQAREKYRRNHRILWLLKQGQDMIEHTPYRAELTEKFVQRIRIEDRASSQPLTSIVPEWAPYFEVDQK